MRKDEEQQPQWRRRKRRRTRIYKRKEWSKSRRRRRRKKEKKGKKPGDATAGLINAREELKRSTHESILMGFDEGRAARPKEEKK